VALVQILVTGGAGFIGSHLCERLIDAGEEVICLDNFFTGSRDNIAHLLDCSRFELVRHDVVEPIRLEVDQIYNLACPASPVHYQFNPVKTVEANVAGTLNALRLAQQIRARILQASTSEVYGDPTVHPQVESYWGNVNPLGPRACYDEGKRVAETLMMDYHRQDGVDIRIARIFNTYGPRMDEADGRVVSNFIVQTLRGEPLTVYGTGEQTRSFCYVDDLVDGLIRLMNAEGVHEPVNLGNPNEFTIRELAEQISEMCGTASSVRYCPLPQDDPVQRQPDISRAKLFLEWTPQVELREGLERTIADFERRLTNPQGSRVRATLRHAVEHSNGKAAPPAAVEHTNGKHAASEAALCQPFFERAELAVSSHEPPADFEGLRTM
jgi:UDP-glucuronate decarboxylase